jgi:hypothetical protein
VADKYGSKLPGLASLNRFGKKDPYMCAISRA